MKRKLAVLVILFGWIAKRPAEELYNLTSDRFQMNNLADGPDYRQQKMETGKLYDG